MSACPHVTRPARTPNDLIVVRGTPKASTWESSISDPDWLPKPPIITRRASERVIRYAFEYARRNGRREVTAVHKANILKITDGLFLKVAREVAATYPDIAYREMIVDAMCMQLVVQPEAYDVLVLTNLFGDIVSDLCAGLVGGLGVAPGANIGETLAVFEPVHGSAPDIAGRTPTPQRS